VEEVPLLLALGRHVVLIGIVDVELVDEVGVALLGDLDAWVARGLRERRHQRQLALLAQPHRDRADVDRDRSRLYVRLAELAQVPALAIRQPTEQPQRRLVGDRVERFELDLDRPQQRRLGLAVGHPHVLIRRARLRHPLEQRHELGAGGAGVVARVAKLVEAAPHLGDGAGVVVEVVAKRVLSVEAGLERQPAAGAVDKLAQDVEVVREAAGALVDAVAPLQ
jgi:hypothetical protein